MLPLTLVGPLLTHYFRNSDTVQSTLFPDQPALKYNNSAS
jgi:hypothetical protein